MIMATLSYKFVVSVERFPDRQTAGPAAFSVVAQLTDRPTARRSGPPVPHANGLHGRLDLLLHPSQRGDDFIQAVWVRRNGVEGNGGIFCQIGVGKVDAINRVESLR